MKFTIRDLFLVTLIVALVLGWSVDHWRQASAAKQVEHDWRLYEHDLLRRLDADSSLPDSTAPAPNPPKP
jgi:hypothetical protein